MFEAQVLSEVYRLQSQMAALRRKYRQFCPQELQTVLRAAHEAIDTAVDTAEAIQPEKPQTDEQHVWHE